MRNALRNTGERAGGGWDPGAIRARLAQLFVPQGIGKKTSTRTPLEPKKAPSHHVHRWHSENRGKLVLEAIRLGVLDSSKPPIGTWRQGGQFRTWQALTAAVERARRGEQ